jgi:hypothetical protein
LKARYVVDTNVLIAASSADPASSVAHDATPTDPALRQRVWKWLDEFERSTNCLVMDMACRIDEEYRNKLGFNDFGLQVLISKYSNWHINMVDVQYDSDGYAILEAGLATTVADRSDRKMVAAALEALRTTGECAVANASDTDWYDWETALKAVGLDVEQIIPEWSKAKWIEKHGT